MADQRTIERLYKAAKRDAEDSLGGRRAFAIASSRMRRHAIADQILKTLALQDYQEVSAQKVRELLDALVMKLNEDGENDWLPA